MGTASYAWEKCYVAVGILAGSGELGERVSDAWIASLMRLKVHEIPWPDLREKFDAIDAKLSDRLGSITTMTQEELKTIAQEIVELFNSVCRCYYGNPDFR